MKSNLLILVTLGIFSCSKEECVTIEDKQEINGNYYFFFGRGNRYTFDEQSLLVPDAQQSGKVSAEDFNRYQVGDQYCY